MDDVRRELILEHSRRSARRGRLELADAWSEGDNPLCGDRVRIELRLRGDGVVADARFTASGCAVSGAVASMLCERAEGRPAAEVTRWDGRVVLELLGTPLTPLRMRCALLPLDVLLAAASWRGDALTGSVTASAAPD